MIEQSRRFGAYEFFTLCDGVFEASVDNLMHLDGDAALERAKQALGAPMLRMVVNCFALRGPDGWTLIDAGCGTAWGDAFGKARHRLRQLGVEPEDVVRVLVTHLHTDHALGLMEGGLAYFPRAEICVPEVDLSFFTDPVAREQLPEARRSGFTLAEQLIQAYGKRLRPVPHGEVIAGVSAMPLPGHTPGHTGYLVDDPVSPLLIFADGLHLATPQSADPRLGLVYDLDPQTAAVTRRDMLANAADANWIVAGCHVDGLYRVEPAGNGYQLASAGL